MDVDFSKGFEKQYKKLPEKIQERFDEQFTLFQQNPHNRSLGIHKLQGKRRHFHSMNVTGNYRALFVWESAEKVVFREIGTHSQLYG